MLPLAAPTLTLILGQEDIGAWPTSATQRRAFDLISDGFGPGANGRLLVAARFSPAAEPSAAYTAKKDEAERLAKGLEKDAERLERQGKALQRRGAALKADKAALERQAAALKAQQAELQAQAAPLLARKDALQAQQQKLLAQKPRLQAQGAALAAQAAALREGAGPPEQVAAQIAAVQAQIAQTTDPVELLKLQAQLAALGPRRRPCRRRRPGRRKAAEAAAAAEAGRGARRRGSQAGAAGGALQAESAALTAQGDALKAQGARLRRRGPRSRGAPRGSRRRPPRSSARSGGSSEGRRAKALKKELVAMLTDAGGQPRATDPRFVRLQEALRSAPGVQSIAPPRVNKSGDGRGLRHPGDHAAGRPETADLVRRLRETVVPEATRGQGVTAYVGGVTAAYEDLAAHDLVAPAPGDRRGPGPELPRAAGRLPLGARAAQGDPVQPAGRRRGVRGAHGVLPVGLGAPADRAAEPLRHGGDRQLRAADHVRGAVRHVHRLRGVPDQPDLPRPRRGHGHARVGARRA